MNIRWWGHATTTLGYGGTTFVTDPLFVDRLAHLRRVGGPTPSPEAGRADVALISHLHPDHLHVPSLRRLPAGTRLVGPTGTAAVLARPAPDLAARVEELAEDATVTVGGVTVRAVHAHHDGRRLPGSRHRGPALGFVLSGAEPAALWFAGDTGLFEAMTDVGPVGVAVVPIGGWGPTLGPHHMDPDQAAEAVRRVGAHDAVPVHYGTFWPVGLRAVGRDTFRRRFREPGTRFAAALPHVAPGAVAHVLRPGEAVELS